ncbi:MULTISPECIES: DUF7124 domain-containing protein [Natrialbaceae]|uniref:DUF7124 domain-containing protein n=1 Tax=Natrialbaceae TaxID=1644061 RepID=UPI00207D68F4|nr:hypothetical protein [Natronococcus sp. CG52]
MSSERRRGELTLVFTVAAVERLANPPVAVADARGWSTSVGVVGDGEPDAVTDAVERADVDPDFVSGAKGTAGSLAAVRQRLSTDRYVVVGSDDEVRRTAQALGWEYLPLEEAAAKAGWELADG